MTVWGEDRNGWGEKELKLEDFIFLRKKKKTTSEMDSRGCDRVCDGEVTGAGGRL